jgi:dTDP-4-amino-4,6-dideoxygalactose transaminase
VVGTSAFVLGAEVERFEADFAAYCGVRHCVGVASGTAALMLLLRAAGIGPGDEVIVPGHTFIASALGVVHAGARVVFCDVDADTGLIDPAAAADAVTDRTAAILAVHLYGQAAAMDAVRYVAARHGLLVLEDAAQAHGATHRGRPVGSLGDGAAFSFYPSKNLGALGDGGAICTDDEEIAGRARRLRDLGQRRKGEHVEIGFNERLDGLQAAFLATKLPYLDAGNLARRTHAATFCEALSGAVTLLAERDETPCVYHLFPIRVPERDEVRRRLGEAGIQAGIHYTPAAHQHPAWGDIVDAPTLPNAERWSLEELSLPMFPELRPDEVEHMMRVCSEMFARTA